MEEIANSYILQGAFETVMQITRSENGGCFITVKREDSVQSIFVNFNQLKKVIKQLSYSNVKTISKSE